MLSKARRAERYLFARRLFPDKQIGSGYHRIYYNGKQKTPYHTQGIFALP
jgi:hypothetical protein